MKHGILLTLCFFDSSISATVGSYLLSVKLAGYIYDQQVASLQAAAIAAGKVLTGPQKCVGPQCFRSVVLSKVMPVIVFFISYEAGVRDALHMEGCVADAYAVCCLGRRSC